MWSYWFCDTRTGKKLLQVKPELGDWRIALNVAEGGSHTFDLADLGIKRETMWDLTTPWARALVQCWNDKPRYAGLITGRPYNRDTHRLTVRSRDVRSIFLARYPFGVKSYWSDEEETIPGKLVMTNLSYRAIAANVVEQGLLGPRSNYGLPIVLPSRTEAGPHSMTIENVNFRKVADVLEDLQRMDGGPDMEFPPRWSATDTLEWVMRVGSTASPALTGERFEFNLAADESQLSAYFWDEDASKQVTGVFGLGEGSGVDRKVGGTPFVEVEDIPARDDHVSFPMAKSNEEAASFATENVKAHRKSTSQPDFSALASEVDPTSLILGSTIAVYDKGDYWNPDGWQNYRLLGLAGTAADRFEFIVQGART